MGEEWEGVGAGGRGKRSGGGMGGGEERKGRNGGGGGGEAEKEIGEMPAVKGEGKQNCTYYLKKYEIKKR